MKKVFRNLFAAIAAVSLVSSFASCSDGSDGDDENTSKMTEGIAVTGNEITFNVTADSTNKDDTVLFVKYDRSAKGAKELITIADAEFKISVNGTVTNTVKKITFELDEYGASFSRAATPIADKDDMKEYKTKIPVGVQVKKSDVVKVQLVKGTITGEGKNAVDLSAIVVALIDKAEKVKYYKELCENSSEYQALVKIEKTEEQKAEEDKAAAEKKAAEEKAAADKKAADEKAAADKKAAEEKAAAEKAKTENSTSTSTTTENNNSGTTNTENENTGAGETPAATVVKTMAVNVNRYSDSEGAPETDHGIQYTEDMTAIPVDAKSGDVWTLKIAGTASDEFRGDMQFVDASWGGITGESISKTFTKEAFDYEIDFTFSKDCSNGKFMLGNAGMDPAVAKTLSLTKYSFAKKSGAAATTPTETPAATDNVVWTGSAELAWSKGDDNGACINKEKFADKAFVGLKFTISAYENETAIKIMSQSNWKDIPFDSAESDCKVADSGNDLGKMLWIWGNTAIVKFSADTLVDIKGNGIKFYGTGVTITKVELVTE